MKVDLYAQATHGVAKICAWPWKQTGIKGNYFPGLFVFTVRHTKIWIWGLDFGWDSLATVVSDGRKYQIYIFNNVLLKVREVFSSTWDLHFRMFLWLKFFFSNQLFVYICLSCIFSWGHDYQEKYSFLQSKQNVLEEAELRLGKLSRKQGEILQDFLWCLEIISVHVKEYHSIQFLSFPQICRDATSLTYQQFLTVCFSGN